MKAELPHSEHAGCYVLRKRESRGALELFFGCDFTWALFEEESVSFKHVSLLTAVSPGKHERSV